MTNLDGRNLTNNVINLYSAWLISRLTFGYMLSESTPQMFREIFAEELERERNLVLENQ